MMLKLVRWWAGLASKRQIQRKIGKGGGKGSKVKCMAALPQADNHVDLRQGRRLVVTRLV